jgi:hypothetical protein
VRELVIIAERRRVDKAGRLTNGSIECRVKTAFLCDNQKSIEMPVSLFDAACIRQRAATQDKNQRCYKSAD